MAQGKQNFTALVTTMDGEQQVVNIKILSAASPPERPQPPGGGGGGEQPPLGIWGPTDPRPTHPISGWNPGSGNFPGEGPGGGGGGGGGGGDGGTPGLKPPTEDQPGMALVKNAPANPDAQPPADLPDATQMLVYFGKGTKPAQAWVGPYAQTQP